MSSDTYPYPVAISRLTPGETSREPQNARAVRWLLEQEGGRVVVVTPRRDFHGEGLKRLVANANVTHLTWRGFSSGSLEGHRVVYAWPNRQLLEFAQSAKSAPLPSAPASRVAIVFQPWSASHVGALSQDLNRN